MSIKKTYCSKSDGSYTTQSAVHHVKVHVSFEELDGYLDRHGQQAYLPRVTSVTCNGVNLIYPEGRGYANSVRHARRKGVALVKGVHDAADTLITLLG